MNPQDAIEYIIERSQKQGVDKIQCMIMDSEKKGIKY